MTARSKRAANAPSNAKAGAATAQKTPPMPPTLPEELSDTLASQDETVVAKGGKKAKVSAGGKHEQAFVETLQRQVEVLTGENAALQARIKVLEAENRRLASQSFMLSVDDDLDLLRNAIIHTVSHEMKTPLLHVKAAVANLAEEYGASKLTEYATSATTRLEGIIRNISLLASSMSIAPVPASFRDALDQALRSLRRSWEHKDHVDRVVLSIEDNLPPVVIDAQAVGMALQLLLDNALKFSHEYVYLNARRIDVGVYVEVVDQGIGIPHDQLGRIFEPFYQVDSSTTRRFSGVGIGLAIVRLIMERHGITVQVESKQGKGSTFCFVLPVANLSEETQSA